MIKNWQSNSTDKNQAQTRSISKQDNTGKTQSREPGDIKVKARITINIKKDLAELDTQGAELTLHGLMTKLSVFILYIAHNQQ